MINFLSNLLLNQSNKLQRMIQVGKFFKKNKVKLIPRIVELLIIRKFNCYISLNAEIDKSVVFPHPTGIVIGEGVKIGANTVIYQQVTIGGARLGESKVSDYPFVDENCIIYAGAKLIGKIRIKNNTKVGANAVVNKSFNYSSTLVGVPAHKVN